MVRLLRTHSRQKLTVLVCLSRKARSKAANEAHLAAEQPNEDFYLDGGLAAPLPVREAYNRGARKIVVIRTVDENFQAQTAWVQKLRTFACASGYCPKTLDYLIQHEQAYLDELSFIANPPSDVEIIQIFADEKLHSKLLGSSNDDLRFDHKLGVKAGRAYLKSQNTRIVDYAHSYAM